MTDAGPSTAFTRRAAQLLAVVDRFERGVTFTAFTLMVGAIFVDVAYRELTGVGLQWARQVGVYANIVVVMLGIGIASAHGAHLRPRFADGWLPARWGPALDRVQDVLMALFCVLLAALAGQLVVESWRLAERSTVIGTLVWPVMAVVPIAFALTALRHALYALVPPLKPSPQAEAPADPDGRA